MKNKRNITGPYPAEPGSSVQGPVQTAAVKTKKHTRRISLRERIPVGFVYFSAAFTIAVLFLILGYIIFNGIFFRSRYEYTVTSLTSRAIGGFIPVANRDTKVKEFPFDVLRGLFTDEYANWKKISGSTSEVYPYIPAKSENPALDVLFPPSYIDVSGRPSGELGALVEYPADTAAVLKSVAGNPGGVALVPVDELDAAMASLDKAERKALLMPEVRDIALVCNPEVTALHGNFRIGSIDESAINSLFSGKITSWKELQGIEMPVILVVPPESSPLYADAKKMGYSWKKAEEENKRTGFPRIVYTSSMNELYEVLRSTAGAVTFAPASETEAQGLSAINLARMETGINLTPSFLFEAPIDSGRLGGISTIILNTFAMILLTLLFSVPPGIFAAIYLVEYAKDGKLIRIIRLGTETLAGVPSIIFGLFGLLVFVQGLGWGICLLSGCLTLTLMILPTIVRTTEEALKGVPHSLQEGSLALGGTKVQTIFRVVLPAAFPSITSGVILAMGRALGETAALIYTMGSNYKLTTGLFDSTRTLAVHIYLIIAEGISSGRAFAAATVLIVIIFAINTVARKLITRIGPGKFARQR